MSKCNCDWNHHLAYPTVKMVMVKDWRLGLFKYSLIGATFLYICIYALYIERGYLDIVSPIGTVTASLQRPPDSVVTAQQFEYCNSSTKSTNFHDRLLCEVWPEDMVLYPSAVHGHMLITTRVSEDYLILNKNCSYQEFGELSSVCGHYTDSIVHKTPHRYLAGIENYTLKFTHAMLDLKHYEMTGHEKYSLTGEQMEGELLNSRGKTMQHFRKEPLIVSLNDLLVASKTDLNANSTALRVDGTYPGESIRHAGIMLMVVFNYDNTYGTQNRHPKYTIRVIQIKQSEYKSTETVYLNETYRMTRDRHGVYLSFIQGGTIGKFNFQRSLLCCVSGLALLGISTLLVDVLMLYCCIHKTKYHGEKYKYTRDYAVDPKLKFTFTSKKLSLDGVEVDKSSSDDYDSDDHPNNKKQTGNVGIQNDYDLLMDDDQVIPGVVTNQQSSFQM